MKKLCVSLQVVLYISLYFLVDQSVCLKSINYKSVDYPTDVMMMNVRRMMF